jgi:uncharacterized protein (DUF2249 family)
MTQVDIHTIQPRGRNPQLFLMFDTLQIGGSLELANNHRSATLYFQFQHKRPGHFEWGKLKEVPEMWRAGVTGETMEGEEDGM